MQMGVCYYVDMSLVLIRDRREYQYRIEKADTKPFGISIGLDRGFFWVSVSVPVSIQRPEHFLQGPGRILIK